MYIIIFERHNLSRTVGDAGPYSFRCKSKRVPNFRDSFCADSAEADLGGNRSADEREVYKGTPSEETAIENKNQIKRKKTLVFNLNNIYDKKQKETSFFAHLLFVFGYAKYDVPSPIKLCFF